LATGSLALLLAIDDLLLVHDYLAPALTGTGTSEHIILVVYVVMVGTWAVVFRREILRSDVFSLTMALALLATSLVIDQVANPDNSTLAVVEDTAKLLGIATFSAFCLRESRRWLLAWPGCRSVG
jgi:hypothetical protein